uniref:Endoplasmic reticulum-Golgi intermediate compartment protein n=1 Tax=Macaca nemestrina TaxID=9545 RepID=A0A2K6BWI9_MACNE
MTRGRDLRVLQEAGIPSERPPTRHLGESVLKEQKNCGKNHGLLNHVAHEPAPLPAALRPTLCAHLTPVPFALRRFDIYRKVPKDLTQPTYTGAIISICCCLFILFLFLSELTGFITTEVVNELYVDDPDKDSGGKIDVSLNISLPNLHCELVGLDIQDEMGRHEVGHIDNSMKIPLNNGAGCRFEGQFSINKEVGQQPDVRVCVF